MLFKATTLLLATGAIATSVLEHKDCPDLHVFGAGTVVDFIVDAHPGATTESISLSASPASVANAVNAYHINCPHTQIVLVGYSQGATVVDRALCGDEISESASKMIRAAVVTGADNTVGLQCAAPGLVSRSTACPSANKIQSFCDPADPKCCGSHNTVTSRSPAPAPEAKPDLVTRCLPSDKRSPCDPADPRCCGSHNTHPSRAPVPVPEAEAELTPRCRISTKRSPCDPSDPKCCGGLGSRSPSPSSSEMLFRRCRIQDKRSPCDPSDPKCCGGLGIGARSVDFKCALPSKIRAFCDPSDPKCCGGVGVEARSAEPCRVGMKVRSACDPSDPKCCGGLGAREVRERGVVEAAVGFVNARLI